MDEPSVIGQGTAVRRGRAPRLDSPDRVRREAVRLYREGRDGSRAAGDVHHLAATLAIVGRMITDAKP